MILGIPKRTFIIVAVLVGAGFIYVMGSDQHSSAGAEKGSTGCTVTVTADILNVRSAPAGDAEIVGKLKQDAESAAEPETKDGFRKLEENKWASAEFLKPADPAKCGG